MLKDGTIHNGCMKQCLQNWTTGHLQYLDSIQCEGKRQSLFHELIDLTSLNVNLTCTASQVSLTTWATSTISSKIAAWTCFRGISIPGTNSSSSSSSSSSSTCAAERKSVRSPSLASWKNWACRLWRRENTAQCRKKVQNIATGVCCKSRSCLGPKSQNHLQSNLMKVIESKDFPQLTNGNLLTQRESLYERNTVDQSQRRCVHVQGLQRYSKI